MRSDQKPFFHSINAQLSLVQRLIADLNYDLSSISKIKRVCPHLLEMLANIEFTLDQIELPEDESLQECQVPEDWEARLAKRTYAEIVGIDETDIEASGPEFAMYHEKQPPEHLKYSPLKVQCSLRGPYRSYDTKEKLNVVRLYNEGRSYASISKMLRIPQKNIVRWCKNGIYRKEGAGRKIGDELMEKRVVEWMQRQYLSGNQVSGKDIRNKAMEYSTKMEFKSSKGWLKNFLRRHHHLAKYVKLI